MKNVADSTYRSYAAVLTSSHQQIDHTGTHANLPQPHRHTGARQRFSDTQYPASKPPPPHGSGQGRPRRMVKSFVTEGLSHVQTASVRWQARHRDLVLQQKSKRGEGDLPPAQAHKMGDVRKVVCSSRRGQVVCGRSL